MLPSKAGAVVCGRRSICRSILGSSGSEWEASGSPEGCTPVLSDASAGDVSAVAALAVDDSAIDDSAIDDSAEDPASALFFETSSSSDGGDGGGESWGRTMRGDGF